MPNAPVVCAGLLFLGAIAWSDEVLDFPPAEKQLQDAHLLIMDDQHESAIPLLLDVIEQQPSLLNAWETLGWVYLHTGRIDESFALWDRLALLDPDLPLIHNMRASTHLMRNDLPEAEASYRKSLDLDPAQEDIRFMWAKVRRWGGHNSDAIRTFRELLAGDPDRMDVRLELARALSSNWEYPEALELWRRFRQIDPENIEYMAAEAMALLHTNQKEPAVRQARRVLDRDPANANAYWTLIDAAEYGGEPDEAIRLMSGFIDVADGSEDRRIAYLRLGGLLVKLAENDPKRYSRETAIALYRRMKTLYPQDLNVRLSLGEQSMAAGRYREAEKEFSGVLNDFNARNLRAQRGLFEIYLATGRYRKARRQLEDIKRFHPEDPFLHLDYAVFYGRPGLYKKAYEHLDALERAGRRGAVAIMLGHILTPSEYGQAPSADRYRAQLIALRNAGYRFIRPSEITEYLNRGDRPLSGPVERVMALTFDDGLETAFLYGTDIARELGIVIGMYLISGHILNEEPFITPWDELRAYQKAGVWEFGSHLHFSSYYPLIDGDGARGYPMGTRLWLESEGRLETLEEYDRRIEEEYRVSREWIERELGVRPTVVAYPYGEVGQETKSTVSDAIERNKAYARANYDIGFIQSYHAHAVYGADPMLYPRHEPDPHATGEEVVEYFLGKHPVFQAQRLRLTYALLDGRRELAAETIAAMEESGYPAEWLDELVAQSVDQLSRRFVLPDNVSDADAPFHFALSRPMAGVQGVYLRDNLNTTRSRIMGSAGVNVAPRLALEAGGGSGRVKQTSELAEVEDVSIDETTVLGAVTYMSPNRVLVRAELGVRDFSGDTDRSVTRFAVELTMRPIVPFEFQARVEHDSEIAARALAQGTTYTLGQWMSVFNMTDRLDLWNSVQWYDFSDGNSRLHLGLNPSWRVWDVGGGGVYMGLAYNYVHADELNNDYWAPYRLHGYYVDAGLRGSYGRIYYQVQARAGVARESTRPEFEENPEEFGEGPSDDWEAAYGVNALMHYRLGQRWRLYGEYSYHESANYDETTIRAGLQCWF